MSEAPVLFPLAGRKLFVAGHRGMVGKRAACGGWRARSARSWSRATPSST